MSFTDQDACSHCHETMLDGELVTGQSWDGQGGAHIECPYKRRGDGKPEDQAEGQLEEEAL